MKSIKILKLDRSVLSPKRGTECAAGWDIHTNASMLFDPGQTKVMPTGICLGIPRGHYVAIVPRSSVSKRGLIIPNAPATIDEDYTGEIKVMLTNTSDIPIGVEKGERIAQMILMEYVEIHFEEVAALGETIRGDGGFGSTGI